MGTDEAKRRQMEEIARRGRSQRDMDASRMSQTARNAQSRGAMNQYQKLAEKDGVVTDDEKGAMKQAMKDGVFTSREKAAVNKTVSSGSNQSSQAAGRQQKPKPTPEMKAQQKAERHQSALDRWQQKVDNAIFDTQIENETGIAKEGESSFKRSFRRSFANTTSKRMYNRSLGGYRSDGKVVVQRKKIAEIVREPIEQRKAHLQEMAQNMRNRADMLQALIIEKGMYTGPSAAPQAQAGPSF